MMTREQALAYIMQNEKRIRRDFLKYVEKRLHEAQIMPPTIRAKFLAAGGAYGEFKINHDWMAELESEIWDGVMYTGLEMLRHECIDPAKHVPS